MRGVISDDEHLNPDEASRVFANWLQSQTQDFMDPHNARFRIISYSNGILQAVKQ